MFAYLSERNIINMLYAAFGALLLVAYSVGHCGLVLAGGTSIGLVQRMADSKGWNLGTDIMRRLAGVLIIAVGIWVLLAL